MLVHVNGPKALRYPSAHGLAPRRAEVARAERRDGAWASVRRRAPPDALRGVATRAGPKAGLPYNRLYMAPTTHPSDPSPSSKMDNPGLKTVKIRSQDNAHASVVLRRSRFSSQVLVCAHNACAWPQVAPPMWDGTHATASLLHHAVADRASAARLRRHLATQT